MAAARDQAARIVRETANDEAAPETGAPLAEQLRSQIADETRRRPASPAERSRIGKAALPHLSMPRSRASANLS